MRVFPEFKGSMAKWPYLETLPSVKQTLSELRSDWILGLATNAVDSDEVEIRQALAMVGIDEFIEKVYCYRHIGHRKPTIDFFEFILEDLGIEPQKVVMVGDSFEGDVLGANSAGLRGVWFNHRTEEERKGDLHRTIHDLSELRAVLEGWKVMGNES
jgi:HAD superfamily hydrolase (TIGR01549 family)